jgi:predicted RNA-binding protein with PIN domain
VQKNVRVRWLVDAMNVIGSRPDGWWRDREGAVRRLVAALRAFAARTHDEVTVVLDIGPDDLAGSAEGVLVVLAPRRGRDAADDEIVRRLQVDGAPGTLTVVTSDAALGRRVRALGAEVEGSGRFRARLDAL